MKLSPLRSIEDVFYSRGESRTRSSRQALRHTMSHQQCSEIRQEEFERHAPLFQKAKEHQRFVS